MTQLVATRKKFTSQCTYLSQRNKSLLQTTLVPFMERELHGLRRKSTSFLSSTFHLLLDGVERKY